MLRLPMQLMYSLRISVLPHIAQLGWAKEKPSLTEKSTCSSTDSIESPVGPLVAALTQAAADDQDTADFVLQVTVLARWAVGMPFLLTSGDTFRAMRH